MLRITVTEFRRRFGKYLKLCQKQDVFITKYGKPLVILKKYEKVNS